LYRYAAYLFPIAPRPYPKEQPAPARRSSPRPHSFAEVINLWPSSSELAAILDVEAVTVRAWRRRGIPARYWSAVAEAARLSAKPVDERLLAELCSARKGQAHG